MKRAKFIINPASGMQDKMFDVEDIIGCLVLNEIVNQVDVAYTSQQHDARKETENLSKGEYDFLVAVGGDGTVNDVVNGVMRSGCEIPIAILSTGTANSFASSLNFPRDKERFCTMIRDFQTIDADIGQINKDYFVNAVAGGLLAEAAYKADRESKAVLGRLAYVLEALKGLRKRSAKMQLSFDSEEFASEEEVLMFFVTNTGSVVLDWQMISEASVSDGWLDVVIFKKMAMSTFFLLLMKFRKNKNLKHSGIRYFRTKKLKIRSLDDVAVPLECDGEMINRLPIELKIVPKAVKFIVPKK